MTTQSVHDRPFQLRLPLFQGEVNDLVRLVTEHKLAVDDISIALVARQYVDHLHDADTLDLDDTGSFLAAAARLTALKSQRLLLQPIACDADADDVPERMVDPNRALYLAASRELALTEGQESIPPLSPPVSIERKSEPHPVSLLSAAWRAVENREAEPVIAVAVASFVRIETAVGKLIRRLRTSARVSFRQFLGAHAKRTDAVMSFLAVLELIRRREAVAKQVGLFGDITVTVPERVTDSTARAG